MKKGILKTLCGLMAALMLLVFAGTPVTTQAAKLPYYIKINRQQNCVTVYALDSKGKYTKPVKAFACSVGVNNATPTGTFFDSGKNTAGIHLWAVCTDSIAAVFTVVCCSTLFFSQCHRTRASWHTILITVWDRRHPTDVSV